MSIASHRRSTCRRTRALRRLALIGVFTVVPVRARAQQPAGTATVGALLARVLLAEARHDTGSAALSDGMRSADPRVRAITLRARARMSDAAFAARDSLPSVTAAPAYPDPAWRLRYRALKLPNGDCSTLRSALADDAPAVRLGAMDLADVTCAPDAELAAALTRAVDALPADASSRTRGRVSWHAAAHAIVALAKVRPDSATRLRVAKLRAHRQWQVRAYAARAASVLGNANSLRTLARDTNDNVAEGAIEALSKLTAHDADDEEIYVAALDRTGAQVVRAAARALKGSMRRDVGAIADRTFHRWVERNNASARDVRVALLEVTERPATDDQPPTFQPELPPRTVALAMGEEVRLRVTMSPKSGGGSFVVRLRGDIAPIMAGKVLALATAGYYNGLTWHRVEPDFVIQGGSPGANEYVGYREFLRDELYTIPHPRGTVGMSTRGHDTGDAQWFVNLRDNARLTKDYTVFAEVVEGIEVVDGVLEGDVIQRIVEVKGKKGR